MRSGIQITSNLYYNSIDVPSNASQIPDSADSVPSNIKTYWYCTDCRKTFSFRKSEVIEHIYETCVSVVAREKNESKSLQNKCIEDSEIQIEEK